MTRDAIRNEVYRLICDQVGCRMDTISPDDDLIEITGFDSLDVVEFIMAIEEEFSIEIPDEEARDRRTPDKVIDYIYNHQ